MSSQKQAKKQTKRRFRLQMILLRKEIGSNFKTSRDELPPIAIKTILPLLCKLWIVFSTGYITIQRINISETNCVIRWIEIYPVDSTMHLLNNWGLDYKRGLLLPLISLGERRKIPSALMITQCFAQRVSCPWAVQNYFFLYN